MNGGDVSVLNKNEVFILDELASVYSPETESKVISLFLKKDFQNAYFLLNNVIEEIIGDLFRPYMLLTLRFRFANTLVEILRAMSFFEKGMHFELPTLDFEIYGKSSEQLKSELMEPFSILGKKEFLEFNENKKLLYKLRKYVDEHIQSDISLSDISEHIGFSPSYTSRIFPKITGMNFKTFVNTSKIEYAKKLLAGGYSIPDVMNTIGFLSRKSFNRAFNQYTGMSPGNYVQQYTNRSEL